MLIIFLALLNLVVGSELPINLTGIEPEFHDSNLTLEWEDYMLTMQAQERIAKLNSSEAGQVSRGKDIDVTIMWDNVDREAVVHLPPRDGEVPMVISIHALGSGPAGQAWLDGFKRKADQENFIVVYPRGQEKGDTGSRTSGRSWNAGTCCPRATGKKVDDVGFIVALVSHLQSNMGKLTNRRFAVDTSRVYGTGMSNGGFMVNRLACEAPGLFAAVAPVSGIIANGHALGWPEDPYDCPKRDMAVPTIHFHGKTDLLVPWIGNVWLGFQSIPSYIRERKKLADAKDDDGTPAFSSRYATCTSYGEDSKNFIFCEHPRGHCWPGQAPCFMDFSATDLIWEFFEKHRK